MSWSLVFVIFMILGIIRLVIWIFFAGAAPGLEVGLSLGGVGGFWGCYDLCCVDVLDRLVFDLGRFCRG